MNMSEPQAATAGPDLATFARTWRRGPWGRYLFPALWLVYLGQVVDAVNKHAHGTTAVVGYLLVIAFAVAYLAALPMGWTGRRRGFWALYAAMLALTAAELPIAHQQAFAFVIYIAVLTVASRVRWSMALVAALALVAAAAPPLVPSWDAAIDWDFGVTVLLVAVATSGFFRIVQANIALAAARAEVARLAAENERSRIARDLHDLLGHSLTTITVKAGLARRLAEHGEAERAFTEIGEVEKLARSTLGDVRAAVSAHRDVTLTGELATAREVLRAAGMIAELPPSVAETEPALAELFGWVVREAVTNAVRHSRANHVRITLGPRFVEVFDDGRGGALGAGNGLRGLRERLAAVGGTLTITQGLSGFRLRAEVPEHVALAEPAPVSVP
jgi:two-component system, NarL family, sensor histidine kinase DesK